MKQLSIDHLRALARALRDGYPFGKADADVISFGMATEYLRAVVDNEWTNQVVFGEHPKVDRINRAARRFVRAEATTPEEQNRHQQRTLRIAELLYNLQDVEGIDTLVEALGQDKAEATYSELEAGAFLLRRNVSFRYVPPSGTKGVDFDGVIALSDGTSVNCEMKCKIEGTELGEGGVTNSLAAARRQLPLGQPGIVFLKVPECWAQQSNAPTIVFPAIDRFLRGTSRVVAVVLRWEQQYLSADGADGAVTVYKYLIHKDQRALTPAVAALLTVLQGAGDGKYVSFRAIAEEVTGQ